MGRALQAEVTAAAKVPPGAQRHAGIVPIRLPVEALALVTPKFPARLLPRLLLSPGGTGGGCPLPGAQPDELSREPCEACAKEQPRLLGEPGEQPRCKGHVAPAVSLCSPELPPARWPIPIAGAAGSRSFPAAGLCEGRKRLPGACRDPGRAGRGGHAQGAGARRAVQDAARSVPRVPGAGLGVGLAVVPGREPALPGLFCRLLERGCSSRRSRHRGPASDPCGRAALRGAPRPFPPTGAGMKWGV